MLTAMVPAHGIGGRHDLPIPFGHVLFGGTTAVAVSFLVLGLLWRTPRLRGNEAGRPLPEPVARVLDHPARSRLLRGLGLLTTVFAAVAAGFGRDDALNPAVGMVYVIFWVGLVPASLVFGPVWRQLNPLRTVHAALLRLARRPADYAPRPLPVRLGYWPAAAGLFAFAWLELAAPQRSSTATLLAWFGLYAAANLAAAVVFGAGWFPRGDAFEAYSTVIGRLSPLGRRADGRLVARSPLAGLDGLPAAPGLVALVAVMFGSTVFDALTGSSRWVTTVQSGPLPSEVAATFGLAATVTVVAVTYLAAIGLSGLLGAADAGRLPTAFAHSIVPVAVGYVIAHYFSLFVFEGQHTLILVSDPLGRGADLFGTAARGVDFGLVSPALIALVQVGGVVIGHVLGVVAAHDRAVRLFPRTQAVVGQFPLLLLMVGYTLLGLTLLFAS